MEWLPYAIGLAVVVLLWLGLGYIAKSFDLIRYTRGADGLPSTSKTQWLLWTIVVLFSYVAIYVARVQHGHLDLLTAVPNNVLIALGLSIVTMGAAKGITAHQVRTRRIVKPVLAETKPWQVEDLGSIVQDDSGQPDLSKLQMMAWTVIALGAYLVAVGGQVHSAFIPGSNGAPDLPDIGATLMLLMGLGQGGYIAKKLIPAVATPIADESTIAATARQREVVSATQRTAGATRPLEPVATRVVPDP